MGLPPLAPSDGAWYPSDMTQKTLLNRLSLTAALLALTATSGRAQNTDLQLLREAFGGFNSRVADVVIPTVNAVAIISKSTPTKEGPAAAFAFEKSHRDPNGEYWKDRPITFAETPSIHPLTATMWSRRDVIADFKKHKTAGQVAIAVIVKTEYCCDNGYRACAVTTAAFEKVSAPHIKKFRVYGAWIKNDRACKAPGVTPQVRTAWDNQVIAEYAFQQGPGATIELINPADAASVHTDAKVMKLYRQEFDATSGATPVLEAKLIEVLAQFKLQ